jgi:predicted alpha/beta hydrolase family esterase
MAGEHREGNAYVSVSDESCNSVIRVKTYQWSSWGVQDWAARVEAAAAELAGARVGVAETGAALLAAAREVEAAAADEEVAVYLPGHPTPGSATSWA